MTDEIQGKADNGKRVQVSLPDYEGDAGMSQRGEFMQLAYRANRSGNRLKPGDELEADGRRWRVVRSGRSIYAKHLSLIDLEPLGDPLAEPEPPKDGKVTLEHVLHYLETHPGDRGLLAGQLQLAAAVVGKEASADELFKTAVRQLRESPAGRGKGKK